jgi:hypothetical protein
MTKEIKLTKGYVALVDDDDYEALSEYKWCACENHKVVYALHCFRHNETGKNQMISMHRFIMGVPKKDYVVDHINHDGLDNRKENLRICNKQENAWNHKTIESKYKGVAYCYWNKRKPFSSHIAKNSKLIHLGYFENQEDAAKAYDKKAVELFGEFACLNFPA